MNVRRLNLVFTLFFMNSFYGCNEFKAPKSNDPREQIMLDQELKITVEKLKRQTKSDNLVEVIDSINNNSTINQECHRNRIEIPTTEDILANHMQVREYINKVNPEYNNLSTKEKIRKNFIKLGGNSKAIDHALCFYHKYKNKNFYKKINGQYKSSTKIQNNKYMVVQDFTLPSSQKRFFLISLEDDPKKGKKAGDIDVMFSSHGMGTKECGTNNELNAKFFSNKAGCQLTPRGFLVSAEKNPSSKAWKWHMKLDGLQRDINDNSRDRLIVFHSGVSSNGNFQITKKGKSSSLEDFPSLYSKDSKGNQKKYWGQGMTWGCSSVAPSYTQEVYEKTKNGALFYNFTDTENKYSHQYCGENLLVK